MTSLQHFYVTTTIHAHLQSVQVNANTQYSQTLVVRAYKLLHFIIQTNGLQTQLRFYTSPHRKADYELGLRLCL